MIDPSSRPHPTRSDVSRDPEASPVDVAAVSERVREAARAVGDLAREAFEPTIDPAPNDADPDHHLWKNGGVWWIAFTAHAGVVQERVRFSLGTNDRALARVRRDAALGLFEKARGLGISLRFRAQGRGSKTNVDGTTVDPRHVEEAPREVGGTHPPSR